jgi:hypothetical protein
MSPSLIQKKRPACRAFFFADFRAGTDVPPANAR